MTTAPTRQRHAAPRTPAIEGREVEDLRRRPACASGPLCPTCGEPIALSTEPWLYCNGQAEHQGCHDLHDEPGGVAGASFRP